MCCFDYSSQRTACKCDAAFSQKSFTILNVALKAAKLHSRVLHQEKREKQKKGFGRLWVVLRLFADRAESLGGNAHCWMSWVECRIGYMQYDISDSAILMLQVLDS